MSAEDDQTGPVRVTMDSDGCRKAALALEELCLLVRDIKDGGGQVAAAALVFPQRCALHTYALFHAERYKRSSTHTHTHNNGPPKRDPKHTGYYQ